MVYQIDLKFGWYYPQTYVVLNCEQIVDTLNCNVIDIVTTHYLRHLELFKPIWSTSNMVSKISRHSQMPKCNSWNAVAMVMRTICMFRHERRSFCNLPPHCPLCPTFHMLDKSPGLKISTCPYWVIVIVPPIDNMKSAFCEKLIYMQFTLCGQHMIFSNMTYY